MSRPASGCLLAGMLALLLAGCAGVRAHDAATFVIVRHAEKADDGTRDPPLSAAGVARAQALAQRLAGARLVAVYATAWRRTQQTAQPVAAMHGLTVQTYAAEPAAAFAAQLRSRHRAGTVLVVGHSNTVPGLVATLCGCRVAALGDGDYDAIYTVRIAADGRGALDAGKQSAPPSPAR